MKQQTGTRIAERDEATRPMATRVAPSGVPRAPLGQVEFVALMAMLFATIALSIDTMLPALPQIATEISPGNSNRAQLIVTSFVLGLGLGSLVTGPLSDAYGRKPLILWSAGLYLLGTALAWQAQSIETMFAARLLQGLGASGPRVAAMAIVRDIYAGRQMARLVSFVMLVFAVVPAIAPSLGAAMIWLAGWRSIFLCFMAFSLTSTCWLLIRQPETLPPEMRRPFRLGPLAAGCREVLTHRVVVLSLVALTLIFAMLFATISSIQQIFDQTFGRGGNFHLWFALIAVCSAPASVVNAKLVERLGMRFMVTTVLGAQILCSGVAMLLLWSGLLPDGATFWVYLLWNIGIFFQVGLTVGNLNALAMEPMGHLAGLTASITSSFGTVLSVAIAAPIGLAFDGTPLPLMSGCFLLATAAFATMIYMRRTDPR